jgi:hypothetical protein
VRGRAPAVLTALGAVLLALGLLAVDQLNGVS